MPSDAAKQRRENPCELASAAQICHSGGQAGFTAVGNPKHVPGGWSVRETISGRWLAQPTQTAYEGQLGSASYDVVVHHHFGGRFFGENFKQD